MVVGDMLSRNANKFRERIAVISGDVSLTYEMLNERVNRLAHILMKKVLRKGDRIGVLVHNCHQFLEIYFAVAKTGGIFCPYNNSFKERELIDIINYSSPAFLFLDIDYGDAVESLRPQLSSIEHYISVGRPRWTSMEDYESLLSDGEKEEPDVEVHDDDIMSIFFTAGTTGKPKGAMRTHKHMMTNAITGVIELKVSYDERALVSFPMYHISCEDNIGRHFFMPNTTVIRREGRFDPQEMLELLSREKISMCQFVPTMILALLQYRDIDRYVICGTTSSANCFSASSSPSATTKKEDAPSYSSMMVTYS